MGDAESFLPASKKRVAGRQLSRDDDPDAVEDSSGQEIGTFQRASDEVIAGRRIVKVRRSTAPSVAPNPFAGIRLVPPTPASSTGETVAKASESTISVSVVGQQPAPQEEGTTVVKNGFMDGKNTDEAVPGPEIKVTDVTTGEAKVVCQTTGKEEVKSQLTEVDKENDKGNKVYKRELEEKNINESAEAKGTTAEETAKEKKGTTKEETVEETKEPMKVVNSEKIKGTAKEEIGEETIKEKNTEEMKVSMKEANGKEMKGTAKEENGEETTKEDSGEETTKEENAEQLGRSVKSQQEQSGAVNSFQQLSSTQNAFSGISGTGFSSSSFSFGSLQNPGSSTTNFFGSGFSSGTGALFGAKSFGIDGLSANANNGGASIRLFGAPASQNETTNSSIGLPVLQEVPVETGEEKEKSVFMADAVLFEYISGGWKERGKGELKVNLSITDAGKARLVMRSKGNYRLILNANLFPDMKLTNMEKRGITFVCINSAGETKERLSTFALKFKDSSIVEDFRRVIEANKGGSPSGLKTPENSPKALEV